jgi:hypothetical protein
MIVRLKDHLRQHAIAYLALFIVLGGSAVALPGKGSVTSNDIAKKAVKSKNIAKRAVKSKNLAKGAVKTKALADGAVESAKLAGGAVGTAKLANGAVTAAKSSGLVAGEGSQSTATYTADAVGFLPQSIVLAEVPTMGVVEFIACFPDSVAGADIRVRLLSFDDAQPFFGAGTVIGSDVPSGTGQATTTEQIAGSFSAGGGSPLIAEGPAPPQDNLGTAGWWDWQLTRGTGNDTVGAHVSVSGFNSSSTIDPTGECTVTATVEYQD